MINPNYGSSPFILKRSDSCMKPCPNIIYRYRRIGEQLIIRFYIGIEYMDTSQISQGTKVLIIPPSLAPQINFLILFPQHIDQLTIIFPALTVICQNKNNVFTFFRRDLGTVSSVQMPHGGTGGVYHIMDPDLFKFLLGIRIPDRVDMVPG